MGLRWMRGVLTVGALAASITQADGGLDWCEGRLLTPQGPVVVRWWKDKGRTLCHAEVPAGHLLVNDSPADAVKFQ